jgi:prevent-host-death family protein
MRQVTAEKLRVQSSEILDAAMRGAPTIVTRYGRPAAVVIDFSWFEELERLRRGAEYEKQFARVQAGDYVDLNDLDRAAANESSPGS